MSLAKGKLTQSVRTRVSWISGPCHGHPYQDYNGCPVTSGTVRRVLIVLASFTEHPAGWSSGAEAEQLWAGK